MNVSKSSAIIAGAAGFAVMLGWIFDVSALKSISPDWVSMKFDTAVSFFLSGILLYSIVKAHNGEFDKAQIVISITSLLIILMMGTLFFSSVLNVHTGVEDLFIKKPDTSPTTIVSGRPSFPTILNFVLMASAGIFTILGIEKARLKMKIIGYAVGIIGLSAAAGYIINAPVLYYYLPGVNCAMACHTAVLFVISGIGFVCL